jgi:acyl-CoA reductase-like NAD-dependent aldehyde dehydrogenase
MHKAARVEYLPLGVVGVICPWNFPFHNILCPTVPALFAGNAVIAKTSEWTAWSAADFQAIFDEVSDEGGLQFGSGPDHHRRRQYGSSAGHLWRREDLLYRLARERSQGDGCAASETLTPVVLELGGKDPMIICDDADLDQAVGAAMLGVFTACGQMCVAAERLYVFDGIYDRFVDKVVQKAPRRCVRVHPRWIGAATSMSGR